jgi:hypothetical protein
MTQILMALGHFINLPLLQLLSQKTQPKKYQVSTQIMVALQGELT